MNIDRLWIIGMIAAMAIVLALGWVLGVSPVLSQTATASDQAASITAQNTAEQTQIAALKTQFANIETSQTNLGLLRQSIPTNADMSTFLQEVNSLCAAHNVTLTSVTVQDATVFVAPGAATDPTAATTGTSTPTPTPTPTPTATAAPSTTTGTPAATPTNGLVTIPIKMTFQGSFADVMAFTKAIQTAPRLLFISELSTGESASAKSETEGNITGTVFSLSGVSGALPADAEPAQPTSTPTPSMTPTAPPSSTSTPTPTDTPKP